VWGSYIHGLFDNDALRHRLISRLMVRNGLMHAQERLESFQTWKEEQYDKLADHLWRHLDIDSIYRIIGL
jgi:adenosylcobyric acid synthase